MKNLTRDQVRQLEVFLMLRTFDTPDFEEACFQACLFKAAEKRAEYRDMRLFDPVAYRQMVAAQRARRAMQPGYRPRLGPVKRQALVTDYVNGMGIKALATKYDLSRRGVSEAICAGVGGKRRPGECVRRATGARNGRAKVTPEIVAAVLDSKESLRATARALGISHRLAGEVKAGRTFVQRHASVRVS